VRLELVPTAVERTTAATDALLALAAAAAILLIRQQTPPSFGRSVWQGALAALAAASVLGAITHGLAISGGLRELLWQPLYLLLGVTMSLFVVGAVAERWGAWVARRALGPMLALALVFWGATRLAGGDFLVFVVYEAAALLFSLVVYLSLAATGRRPGAGTVSAALALSLIAGAVQAAPIEPLRLVWQFDHNGLFHLVQLLGLALLVAGLRRRLRARPAELGNAQPPT
jgi:hypothetical protein